MSIFNLFKKKESASNGPDFSEVDSNEKAIQMFNDGKLSKIYLMPLECGGQDSPMNYLFAPAFAVDLKDRFDSMIFNLLEQGKKLNYSAKPEYKGKSFIPSKIIISVSGDANFTETINIW